MRALITGVAGFIGSHLAEALLAERWEVVGVDAFTDFYDPALKRENLGNLKGRRDFTLIAEDLLRLDLGQLLDGVDVVFHLAAQAGVRASWGSEFEIYTSQNILATQRLLEATRGRPISKLVYASSSSVYGDAVNLPMREGDPLAPLSPYGVSKLAAEHLCHLYWVSDRVPVVSLRYFTVFGPRQRPDMAFHRFTLGLLRGEPLRIYGDGHQTRDFTYVSDVVEATIRAATIEPSGEVINIAGGARVSLLETIHVVEELVGASAQMAKESPARGDVRHTYADISKARALLGYVPRVSLSDGLKEEIAWLRSRRDV